MSKITKLKGFFTDWQENKGHIKWIFKQCSGFKRFIFGFMAINLFSMLLSLVSSVASKYVVDAATGYSSGLLLRYVIIMLSATVVTILFSMFSNMFSSYVNEKFAFSIRAKMFDRVQRSVWKDVSKYHSGDLLSRLTADVDSISSGIIGIIPNTVITFIQLVIVLFVLLKYDPTLAVIGLVIGPLGLIAAISYRKRYSRYQLQLRESQSEYYSFFQESLSNIGVIKTFQLEDENNSFIADLRKKRLKLIIKSSRLSAVMSSLMRLIYSLGYVAAFCWCAYRLTTATTYTNEAGQLVATYTYGTMTLFLSLVSQIQSSIRGLGSVIPQMYSMIVCAKRIRTVTDLDDEDYTTIDTMPKSLGLKADNVSFTYDSEKVLDNISFEISPHRHVGIVGTSGAGKTTLIRLLLSLVKPDSGTLTYIDENNHSENACPSSRRFISYVPQGNTLLSGTIRKNLHTANKNATEQQMFKALDMADAADFVMKTPRGLDTELSEKAGGLSEGQAQRISIARAILRDKPVLILDEATSALDENTEAKIFERITKECDKTCFIITHRRSMLSYCDSVIEIDDNGSISFRDN